MGNSQEQKDEVEVLKSIFDENGLVITDEHASPRGTLYAHPVLKENFVIVSSSETGSFFQKVQFLPPIKLHFKMVPEYPSSAPPAFLLACQWLTIEQLSILCKKLEDLYKENLPEVVIYSWAQFLQDEALSFLGIEDNLDITDMVTMKINPTEIYFSPPALRKNKTVNENSEPILSNGAEGEAQTSIRSIGKISHPGLKSIKHRSLDGERRCRKIVTTDGGNNKEDYRAIVDLTDGSMLLPNIIEWNEKCKRDLFNKEWFTCKVCLSQRQGSEGFTFKGCEHIYCRDCIGEYFKVQIKEGNVQLLTCPEEKCSSSAIPSQVYDLVGQELYARYDALLLDSALSQMSDVVLCPRQSCQCSTLVEKGSTMGSCSACQYHFCLFCKRAYHGLQPCRFKLEEKKALREEYTSGNAAEKAQMEQRFGKKVLLDLVNDSMSEEWVEGNSKKCPHCQAAIEKSDGCNKMICWRCKTFFCWLCNRRLNELTPYLHYNDPKSPCFGFLFHGMAEQDSDDEDDWRFGVFL